MIDRFIIRVSSAVLMAAAISAAGQAQAPAASAAAQGQDGASITVAGCVVHDRDYAEATGRAPTPAGAASSQAQLVLTAGDASAPAYSLTGTREPELARHVDRRVEITGTVEPVRVAAAPAPVGSAGRVAPGVPPTGANGVTPGGSPAHEPGDALPGTAATAGVSPAQGATAAPGSSASSPLPRINVTSFRVVEGVCDDVRRESAVTASSSASPNESSPPPRLAATERPPEPVTAVGCLVRQTPAGGALTAPAATSQDELVLTRASVSSPVRTTPAPGGSAVPGSSPSGSGSGTVGATAAAGRTAATVEEQSFVLAGVAGSLVSLGTLVGQRVEVTGTIEEAAASNNRAAATGAADRVASPAHTSAPVQRITMTSFRPVGGTCN